MDFLYCMISTAIYNIYITDECFMMYSTSYSSEPIPGRLNLDVQMSELPQWPCCVEV